MVLQPLHAVGGTVVGAVLAVGVHVHGAEVDVGQSEDVGEGFAGLAVVGKVPVMGAGALVEVADPAKGD